MTDREIDPIMLSVLAQPEPETQEPSFLSEFPDLALGTIVTVVITIIITAILSVKFWKPVWRLVTRQTPVRIHVETDIRKIVPNLENDTVSYPQFVPFSHNRLPPPPDGFATEMGSWAEKNHGFAAVHCNYGVTITAREDLHVVVTGLRVEAKSVPLSNGSIVTRGVGGASMEFRRIQVELNTIHSTAAWVERGGLAGERFKFHLGPGEAADFSLFVDAATAEEVDMYEWWGYLDLLVNSKPKTVRIGRKWWQRWFVRGDNSFRLVNRGRRSWYMHHPGSNINWEEQIE